jgi:hypothetical protein
MLPEYKRRTNVGVFFGWMIMTLGGIVSNSPVEGTRVLGYAVIVIGLVPFVWGCTQYSVGKGHSPYLGAFGLLWLPGFLVLYFLPDKHKVRAAV